MEKIVILDSLVTNPDNDLWESIKSLGELIVYDRTDRNDIVARASDAKYIMVNKTTIDDSIMEALPNLKYIGLMSTGTNAADLEAAKKRGIVVTNIPAYSTDSVAQLIFTFILNMSFRVIEHNSRVHSGEWTNCQDFCFYDRNVNEIKGKTLGLIGFGSIGGRVAEIATVFGMNIVVYSRTKKDTSANKNITWVSKDEVFKQSDYLALACPLTDETENIINKDTLSLMKSTACVINTSRGGCVVEADLAATLNSGTIAYSAVDVLSTEPPKADNPLLSAKNCIITPHIAWTTREARERLAVILHDNLKCFMAGNPQNVVNK